MEPFRSCFSTVVGLPLIRDRSAPALPVSGPAQRSLRYSLHARGVAIATLYIEGFSGFVTSTAASIATGWSEPVPGRDLHPLKATTFPQRTRMVGKPEPEPWSKNLNFWIARHPGVIGATARSQQ